MALVATEINWREADLADVDSLCQLLNQSYRPPVGWEGWLHQAAFFGGDFIDAAHLKRFMAHGTVIVTHRQQQILGAVALRFENAKAFVDWLAVPAPCQSLGLGKFLLYRAEVLARAGMAQVFVLPVLEPQFDQLSCLLDHGFTLQPEAVDATDWPWLGEPLQPVAVRYLEKPLSYQSTYKNMAKPY